jgi:hypothetical protein
LLISHDKYLTLDYLAEIRKQSALEKSGEAEEHKPGPKPKEGNEMISKLTEGFGLTEGDSKMLEDTDSTEQLLAAARQRVRGMIARCEGVLKEKKRSWSH